MKKNKINKDKTSRSHSANINKTFVKLINSITKFKITSCLAFIATIITILAFCHQLYWSYDKVANRLDKLCEQKNWNGLAEQVKKIQNKEYLSDIYYYYSGILSINTLGDSNPELFFNSIKPTSKLYIAAYHQLVDYHCTKLGITDQKELKDKLLVIASKVNKSGNNSVYFYYLELISMDIDYSKTLLLYKAFKQAFTDIMNWTTFEARLNFGNNYDTATLNIKDLLSVSSAALMFNYRLYVAAKIENRRASKDSAYAIINKIIKTDTQDLLKQGFDILKEPNHYNLILNSMSSNQ